MTDEDYAEELAEEEYRKGLSWACTFDHTGRTDSWNERFVRRLLAVGLMIVPTLADPGYYLRAPCPTAQDNGKPHTPETDPWAWPKDSWVVPVKIAAFLGDL